MPYQTLALMLGYRCNARCRCCLWGEKTSCADRINVEEAKKWIDEACASLDIRLIGFSGGESFIYRKELAILSEYAWTKYGIASAVSTNCYWATSKDRAVAILKSLQMIGLKQLLVSADQFHQEFIPIKRVGFALQAARELGIITTLQTVVTLTSKKLADVRAELSLGPDDELLRTSEIFCTQVGSAISQIPECEFPPRENALSEYCSLLRVLIIDPQGDVFLCCGPAFAIPQLKMGNIRRQSLKEIIECAEWNPLFNALAVANGPIMLTQWIPETLRNKGYSSSCEACQAFLSLENMAEKLELNLENVRAELFMKRMILEQESPESLRELVRF